MNQLLNSSPIPPLPRRSPADYARLVGEITRSTISILLSAVIGTASVIGAYVAIRAVWELAQLGLNALTRGR